MFFNPLGLFSGLFQLAFTVIVIGILYIGVRSLIQVSRNNQAPRLIVDAAIVKKRQTTTHHNDANGITHTDTSCYITFQVESGDCMELYVPHHEYRLLSEGDYGKLTFQGTRYLSFAPISE